MVYNKLFFNSIPVEVVDNKIVVTPNFLCPNPECEHHKQHDPLVQEFSFNVNKTFDFNKNVTFTLPCCGAQISLNVAVHKEKGEPPQICISVPESPIPETWHLEATQI